MKDLNDVLKFIRLIIRYLNQGNLHLMCVIFKQTNLMISDMYKLKVIIPVLFFTFSYAAKAASPQNGAGGSLIYNFQTNSIGLGLRAEYPLESINLLDGVSLVPQISYFPSFNEITEFYIGSSVHLGIYTINKKWSFYGLLNLSYNGWINYDDSGMRNARFSNLGIEGGVGVTMKRCVRPFLELRYNAWWRESNIQLGIIYTIKCERRGSLPCPKIPPPPQF
jgi:hypothetical protein